MKTKLLAAVLIWGGGFGNTVFAQKEHNIWYFGDSVGVDFNSGLPVALTDGMLHTTEGCSSISDANGNLLFYTDGTWVWDRNHNQMPNGDSLEGGNSSTQSALIVPFPGNNLMYYIFTVGQIENQPIDFNYSIVNMSLNGGNGAVTIKNNIIQSPVSEKLTAVKHSNGNDIWVMVHGYGNDSLFAYLITGSGITTTPVVSKIGQIFLFGIDAVGYMKFSPDGSKLAFAAFGTNYVNLFDFDATTGLVSNEKYLTMPAAVTQGAYGLEFSGNGNFLYANTLMPPKIYQWDITSNIASVINATQQMVGISTAFQFGALQLAPDGKIYAGHAATLFLGAINNPDLPGSLCNYADTVISLNIYQCMLGLPNFITSYFLPTGINTNTQQQNQLTISPNPSTDKIYISFPAITSKTITTKIFSITGEVVFGEENKTGNNNFNKTIDINGLSNGIYFLSVHTGREVMTRKIVVNH